MDTTDYFNHMRKRPDRINIKMKWIREAVKKPEAEQIQLDGRIRKWKWIKQEKKYLRVIVLADGKTVHNAFFDRSFKGEKHHEN